MQTKSKLVGSLVIALSVFFIGCGGQAASGEQGEAVVSYGGQTIVPDLVFRAKDWGKPYGIKIEQEVFSSGGTANEALLAGEVDASNGGSGRLITIAAQNPDEVLLVASYQYGGDRYSVLVPPDSPLQTAEDLRGKTVAIDTGSGAYTLFIKWLSESGLGENDVEIIQTEVENVATAVQTGSADVGVAWEPTASIIVEKGIAKRLTTLGSVGQSPNFILVDRDFAESNREAVVRFLAAISDLGEFIERNPDKAGQMASEVAAESGTKASASAYSDALQRIEMKPEITDEQLNELTALAKEYQARGEVPSVPNFKSMVDTSYLQEAQKLRKSD